MYLSDRYTAFGKLLSKRLEVRNSSITALAESLGVSVSFVCNVCCGRKALAGHRLEQIYSAIQADARERRTLDEAWWISCGKMPVDWKEYTETDKRFLYRVVSKFRDTSYGKRDKILALLGGSESEEEDTLLW